MTTFDKDNVDIFKKYQSVFEKMREDYIKEQDIKKVIRKNSHLFKSEDIGILGIMSSFVDYISIKSQTFK